MTMSKNLKTSLGLGATLLVASMTANATLSNVFATDILTYDDDIIAETSGTWGACPEGSNTCSPSPSASLKYTVSYEVGTYDGKDTYKWLYEYEWFGDSKDLSHIIIEVSSNFTSDDILAISTDASLQQDSPSLATHSAGGNSNPSMPEDMYGLKFDLANGTDVESLKFSILTWRAPEWGDFYAKDGTDGGSEVYAYNRGFVSSDSDPVVVQDVKSILESGGTLTYESDHILRPDSVIIKNGTTPPTEVPEPATLGLLGLGMLAIGAIRRRKVALKD